MPQPKSISPGKGGKHYGKKSKSFGKNMVWLNRTHSLLNLQAKFFKVMFCTSVKFTANYANSAQFAPNIPHHFCYIIHHVSDACPGRKFQRIKQISCHSPTTSANHAKFAPFINSFYIMFQMPAPAENSSELTKFHAIHPQLP